MKNFVGVFLTGTAAEVTPVAQISEFNFTVCDLITDLMDSYQTLVRKKQLLNLIFAILVNCVVNSFS